MKPILILYATRDGQTRKIAEHVAGELSARAMAAELLDARTLPATFDLGAYGGAILAASVRYGKHERELVDFARTHKDVLSNMPNAFLSVSGSEATAEDANATGETRARAAHDVQDVLDRFVAATGWRPTHAQPVAGAMLFTKYNFLVRFIIKQIAKRNGTKIDPTKDSEYTDWAALDRFVSELAPELAAAT